MAFKIVHTLPHVEDDEACSLGIQNEIIATCDSESDLISLGTNWYPNSRVIICNPFSRKILSASHQWVDVPKGY